MDTDVCQTRGIVGAKEVKRGLKSNTVEKVYIAKDADSKVTKDVIFLANESNVGIEYVESKEELGKLFGIEINAATAALLK